MDRILILVYIKTMSLANVLQSLYSLVPENYLSSYFFADLSTNEHFLDIIERDTRNSDLSPENSR